jgi:hypothetical protein
LKEVVASTFRLNEFGVGGCSSGLNHLFTLKMEVSRSSETSERTYRRTLCEIRADCYFSNIHRDDSWHFLMVDIQKIKVPNWKTLAQDKKMEGVG